MIHADDDWGWWLDAERRAAQEEPRTFRVGCVLSFTVCVLFWIAAICAAVHIATR